MHTIRLGFLLSVAAILVARVAADDQPSTGKPPSGKPNVLFIAVDDLNHWVGHLGRNPQTRRSDG